MKIRILEVDQWTSTGNVKDFTLEDFDPAKVRGGDSEAIRKIGGWARIIEVDEDARPSIGHVWFRPGPDGKLQHWKANYDSSD